MFEEDKKLLETVDRKTYCDIFKILSDNSFKYGGTITFQDIFDITNKGEINNDFLEYLGVVDKIKNIMLREETNYTSEESEQFINEVKSSNITDIADSGWFYKKLASALDSTHVIEDNCGSDGVKMIIPKDFSEDEFNYRISCMNFSFDGKEYNVESFEDFKNIVGDGGEITLFSPLSCKHVRKHCFCKHCVGKINVGGRELPPDNIGLLTVLFVTEASTQASLDSMNKGQSEGINTILEKSLIKGKAHWSDYENKINSIIDYIGPSADIQKRWYEISLVSRIFAEDPDNIDSDETLFTSIAFQNTNKHYEDKFGSFLFSPTLNNFKALVSNNQINITSEKSKMLFDI